MEKPLSMPPVLIWLKRLRDIQLRINADGGLRTALLPEAREGRDAIERALAEHPLNREYQIAAIAARETCDRITAQESKKDKR